MYHGKHESPILQVVCMVHFRNHNAIERLLITALKDHSQTSGVQIDRNPNSERTRDCCIIFRIRPSCHGHEIHLLDLILLEGISLSCLLIVVEILMHFCCKRRPRLVQNRRDKNDPPHITFHSLFSPLLSVSKAFFLQSLNLYI